MKRLTLVTFLMIFSSLATAGEWVFRPIGNGSLRMSQQGSIAELGPETLVQRQSNGEPLTIQVIASGLGRCDNGILSGSGPLEAFHIAFTPVLRGSPQTGQQLKCGESLSFDASAEVQLSGVKAEAEIGKASFSNFPISSLGSRVLLGSVNFISANHGVVSYSLYLDLSTLRDDTATLNAAFDKPGFSFGSVSIQNDVNQGVKLKVSKTTAAGNEAIPYTLTLESTQARGNSFQLKSTTNDLYVPYQIKIGDTSLVPGNEYLRTVAAGSNTADVIDVNFYLSGKNINGLKAGTRLMDTVTAIIMPKS